MLKGRKINLLGNRPRSGQDNVEQALKLFIGEISSFLAKDSQSSLVTNFFEKTKQTSDVLAELKNFETVPVLNEFTQFLTSVKNELNPDNPFDEKFKALMGQARETANYLKSSFSGLDEKNGLQLVKNYTSDFVGKITSDFVAEEKALSAKTNGSSVISESKTNLVRFDLKLPQNFFRDLFDSNFNSGDVQTNSSKPVTALKSETTTNENIVQLNGKSTHFSFGFDLADLFKTSANGHHYEKKAEEKIDDPIDELTQEIIEDVVVEENDILPEISAETVSLEESLPEEIVEPDYVENILEDIVEETPEIQQPVLLNETSTDHELDSVIEEPFSETEIQQETKPAESDSDNFHWMMNQIVSSWNHHYSSDKYFPILKTAIGDLIQNQNPISAFREVSQNSEYVEFCDFLEAISNNPDFNRDFVVNEIGNIASKTYQIFTAVIREQTEGTSELAAVSDEAQEPESILEEEIISESEITPQIEQSGLIEDDLILEEESISEIAETTNELVDDFSTPDELDSNDEVIEETHQENDLGLIDDSEFSLEIEEKPEEVLQTESKESSLDYYKITVKIYQDVKQLNAADENNPGINQFVDFSLSLKDPIETLREHLEIQDVKDFTEFVDVLHEKFNNNDLTAYQPLIDHETAIAEQIYSILKSHMEIYGDSPTEEYSDNLRLIKTEENLEISDSDTANVFDDIESPIEETLEELPAELNDEMILDDSGIIEEGKISDELSEISDLEEPIQELAELEEIIEEPISDSISELDELSEITEEPKPASKPIEVSKPQTQPSTPVESITRPTEKKELNEIQKIFLQEADEYIQKLSNDLLALEKDLANHSLIDSILRSAHTLKGSAGMMKFQNMNKLGHKMEDVFQFLRDEKVPADRELVDIMLKGTDLQQAMLNSLQENGHDFAEGVDKAIFQLQEYLKKLEAKKDGKDYTEEKFVPAQTENVSPVKTESSVQEAGENKPQQQGGGRPIVAEQNLRINISTLNSLINLAAELLISRNRMNNQLGSMEGILSKLQKEKSMLQSIMKKFQAIAGKNDIDTEFLSSEEQGILKDFADTEFDRFSDYDVIIRDLKGNISNYEDVSREIRELGDAFRQSILSVSSIANELNREIMGMRMVPVKHMFIRFQRSIRDIGREENKDVDLRVEGEETRLDKTVMEEVIEPIMHCVRNAVSHGIELPDVRETRGKKREGMIVLRAFQDGNQVVLEIEDDGNGIDPAKLKQSAINKKLISPERSLSMTDAEAMELMFVPGFSTAERVTTLSGRGVGMDVVKNVVTRFKGSVSVKSNIGKGSKFIIRLPLTLAINQSLLIQVSGRIYAFPLSVIEETVELKMENIRRIGDQELITVRDQTIPLIHLNQVLGTEEDASQMKSKYPVVILSDGGQKIGVRVDRLLGKEEIVIKSLGSHLKNVAGVVGATVLGDGSVVLIMDVGYLFLYWQGGGSVPQTIRSEISSSLQQLEEATNVAIEPNLGDRKPEAPKPSIKGKIRILCADDSVSIRKYVASLLSRERFDVTTAADGAEAYEYAERNTYDIIMTDLEMPKMHGYELISAIRSKAAFNHIPIVILTARSGEKHRRRGLELGANAFLNKPFDVDELLNTIDGLLGK